MAKRRSKKDKQRARSKQRVQDKGLKKKIVKKDTTTVLDKIFAYDLTLIKKDLKKTILVTLIILVVLAIISLRYT